MFHFQPFQPSPALRNYVYCYLVADVVDNGDLMMIHEALPMAITTICFAETKNSYANRTGSEGNFLQAPDIAMVGQMFQKGESIFSRPSRSVVALFKVTGLYQLSGIPMNLVAGRYSVDATSLLSAKEFSECREQMFQHVDPAKVVGVLDNFLIQKFKTRPSDVRNIDKVAECINQKRGIVNLDWLTNQTCMSVKTLERHFAEKIGVTPKYFSRIVRFRNAFGQLEKNARHNDIMKIVDTCGYTDQAHLIKEFKHFTGRTPKFYYSNPEVLSPYFLESSSNE